MPAGDLTTIAAEAAWPRARLDAEYSARACVTPDAFNRIIGDYARLSAPAFDLPDAQTGLVHDAASGQRIDLFGTAAGQSRPLFLFLHGGYWRALSKEQSAFMAPMLAARGIACAVPDYTLASAATLTEIVRQCRAALAFLWHNASLLGIDRNRIVVGGSSAGGHLAGTLLSPGWQAPLGLPDRPIVGALPVSGLFELAPIAASHVNEWMRLAAQEIDLLSPLRHPPRHPIRCTVALAQTETPGFQRQSAAYAERLAMPVLTISGRNHFDVILELTDPATDLSRALLGLF